MISLNPINISQDIILQSTDREIRKDSFYPNQNNKKKNPSHKEKEKSKDGNISPRVFNFGSGIYIYIYRGWGLEF